MSPTRHNPQRNTRPQPPSAATLPLVVAALVIPAAASWVLSPYLGILVTALAAAVLVVVAVNLNR